MSARTGRPARAAVVPDQEPVGLSEQQREVYKLARSGATQQEIAERLGISVGSVKAQLSRIRQKATSVDNPGPRGRSVLFWAVIPSEVPRESDADRLRLEMRLRLRKTWQERRALNRARGRRRRAIQYAGWHDQHGWQVVTLEREDYEMVREFFEYHRCKLIESDGDGRRVYALKAGDAERLRAAVDEARIAVAQRTAVRVDDAGAVHAETPETMTVVASVPSGAEFAIGGQTSYYAMPFRATFTPADRVPIYLERRRQVEIRASYALSCLIDLREELDRLIGELVGAHDEDRRAGLSRRIEELRRLPGIAVSLTDLYQELRRAQMREELDGLTHALAVTHDAVAKRAIQRRIDELHRLLAPRTVQEAARASEAPIADSA